MLTRKALAFDTKGRYNNAVSTLMTHFGSTVLPTVTLDTPDALTTGPIAA